MAIPFSLPSNHSSRNVGLEVWMERVLERADQVRENRDADGVHDLRVALRRCRTIAEASSEVNPSPGWRKLKRATREVFHDLGDLRDTQVQHALVKTLGAASDPVRRHLLRVLSRQEEKQRQASEKALDKFDRKEWKKLTRKLASKSRFFPLNSVVYQRLALSRLQAATEMLQNARRRPSSVAWHRLRIGIKSFRYLVENFLPQRYEAWSDDLKQMQDLLGEVHDLDVLRQQIRRTSAKLDPAAVAQWKVKIERERKTNLQHFLGKASGPQSPWLTWLAGFQWSHTLVTHSVPAQRRTA
ncbi:MAG: CHAD domain-containing protein [Candidatus Acidiferrales bacterium]